MKTFYVSLILSILLLVGGFLSPPLGIIDSSVLSAVGLLFAFATLAQLPQLLAAIAQGRTFRLTKGDLTAEVTSNSGETWQENLIQSGSLHKGWAWLFYFCHFCQSHFCHFRFLMSRLFFCNYITWHNINLKRCILGKDFCPGQDSFGWYSAMI